MCIFSPSWEGIETCIYTQQLKDIQEDYQQIRDFNRFLEYQKKKKDQEVVAIKTEKSRAYKVDELAVKEPVYQWSSYRLNHNMMVKAEKQKDSFSNAYS